MLKALHKDLLHVDNRKIMTIGTWKIDEHENSWHNGITLCKSPSMCEGMNKRTIHTLQPRKPS
jgi:hypothetical protein